MHHRVLRCVEAAPGLSTEAHLHRTEHPMNTAKLVGIVLIAAGVIALVYGSFSYTKDTSAVKLGPLELTVKEKETVNVPVWAGVGAIVIGGLLLVMGGKKG
jgi:multidrug transporter EmrE-like cation transporter